MSGIIVLEGPDCAGKTTLAKRILELDSTAKYIHMTYRFKTRMSTYHIAAIHRAIQYVTLGRNVVIDRWWPSAEIYAQTTRYDFSANKLGFRLQPLMHRYGLMCICLPDIESVLERHLLRIDQELYKDMDNAARIYDAYFDLAYGNAESRLGGLTGKITRSGGALSLRNWIVTDPFTSKALPERLLAKLEYI